MSFYPGDDDDDEGNPMGEFIFYYLTGSLCVYVEFNNFTEDSKKSTEFYSN